MTLSRTASGCSRSARRPARPCGCVRRLDGPALGCQPRRGSTRPARDALAGFDEETRRFVAAATGQSTDAVRTEVVTDGKVGGSVIDPDAFSPEGGDGRVGCCGRRRPAGRWCARSASSTTAAAVRTGSTPSRPPCSPRTLPLDEPVVVRLDDARPRVGRFLVVAPGADRVQLLLDLAQRLPAVPSRARPRRRRGHRRGHQRRLRVGLPAGPLGRDGAGSATGFRAPGSTSWTCAHRADSWRGDPDRRRRLRSTSSRPGGASSSPSPTLVTLDEAYRPAAHGRPPWPTCTGTWDDLSTRACRVPRPAAPSSPRP